MDKYDEVSFDDYDEQVNPKPEENDFDRILELAITRRGLLKSVMAVGSVAIMRCHRRQQARQRAEMVGGRKQVARGQGAKVRLGGDAGTTQDVAR